MILSKPAQAPDHALKLVYARLGTIRLLLSDMRRSSMANEAVKIASRTQAEALAALLRQTKVTLSRDSKANLIHAITRSSFEDCDATALLAEVDKADGKEMDLVKAGWSMQPFAAVINTH